LNFDPSCIFCKIVKKQAPASVIYENQNVLAFLDIKPLTVGHTLVIPKAHYVDIFDTPEIQLTKVHKVAKQIALAVKKTTAADGISIVQQNCRAAGQDIFHLHVHVVPRFEGQKLPQFAELREVDRTKLDDLAFKIKQNLPTTKEL